MAIEVLVPPLGTTVDTVTLVKWYSQEGETVAVGAPLFAVETDKATLDVEAPASGVLRQVTAQVGDAVQALSVVALIAAQGEAPLAATPAAQAPPGAAKPEGIGEGKGGRIFVSPRARQLAEERQIPLAALRGSGPEGAIVERDVRAYSRERSAGLAPREKSAGPSLAVQPAPAITPVAQRMAEEAGLEWRQLAGSGPGGRVTREDVSHVLETTATPPQSTRPVLQVAPVTNEPVEVVPVQGVRAVIADRMSRSHTEAARVTLTAQADATALVALRQQLGRDGVAVSYNDLFITVAARALREHPRMNASLDGEAISVWRRIHIGLAVDTERGLLVPVVRDADTMGLSQLAQETQALVARAQAGRSTPEDLSGGTFTLTNLGMYGIDVFTPIINLPECAVLGVGRISRQPVMVDDNVVGRQMVWLSLSFDHRLVDGAPAARFLQRVAQLVEGPHLLMA